MREVHVGLLLLLLRTYTLVGEIEGGEADEGAVAGDLVDDEVGVPLLEGAAEAGERISEAGDADVGLGQGGAELRGWRGYGASAAGEGTGGGFCEGERGEDGVKEVAAAHSGTPWLDGRGRRMGWRHKPVGMREVETEN